MMKTPKQKLRTWKWSSMAGIVVLVGIAFSCNDEVEEDVNLVMQTASQVKMPESLNKTLQKLQEKYPEAEFIYMEAEGSSAEAVKNLQNINPRSIATINIYEERGVIGMILNKNGPIRDIQNKLKRKSKDEVFQIVEDPATPEGGYDAFYKRLAERLRYPEEARSRNYEGTVYIQFVVDENGVVTNVQVVRGIGYGCDEAAVKAIASSGKWNPGLQRGKAVKQRIVLPVKFSLDASEGEVEVVKNELVKNGNAMSISTEKSIRNGKTLIKGSVVNSEGEPLAGANVVNLGTTWGTVTNKQGEFTFITDQSSGKLSISFVGYKKEIVNY